METTVAGALKSRWRRGTALVASLAAATALIGAAVPATAAAMPIACRPAYEKFLQSDGEHEEIYYEIWMECMEEFPRPGPILIV